MSSYTLDLAFEFNYCPREWQGFINMLDTKGVTKTINGFSVMTINEYLIPYNAVFCEAGSCSVENPPINYVYFTDEADAAIFKLTFGT